MYVFQPAKLTNFRKLISVQQVFTPEECAQVVSFFQGEGVEAGVHKQGSKDPTVRSAKITWLKFSPELDWIFKRLWVAASSANDHAYKFQMSGFYEALQLTRYFPGDHYTWHEDSCEPHFTTRKLSLVVQLTDPLNYSGGDLKIFPNEGADRSLGSVSFFPSFLTHKVTPVTEGERFSLVAWITGEPFR
jgi:PKHD-type hydroxylase